MSSDSEGLLAVRTSLFRAHFCLKMFTPVFVLFFEINLLLFADNKALVGDSREVVLTGE